jgi:hypothetical protein
MPRKYALEHRLRKKVVVIGGGFAGLSVAKAFSRQPVDVILIDCERTDFGDFLEIHCECGPGPRRGFGKITANCRSRLVVDCEGVSLGYHLKTGHTLSVQNRLFTRWKS